ncbi:MAG: hypothetical protein COA77_00145 [Thaumarchaeota archaeon]|nr:MAG: hypothetical protein COA77_00145 [Nitrososphaerota archaeon]
MDYNSLNSDIIKLNPKIRYAGIYHTGNVQIWEKLQQGITRFFDKEKTNDTLIHAYMRWRTRQHDASIIGQPLYSITKYAKINRLTIPVNSKALLMINSEPEFELQEIVVNLIELIVKYSDDPNYSPRKVYLG